MFEALWISFLDLLLNNFLVLALVMLGIVVGGYAILNFKNKEYIKSGGLAGLVALIFGVASWVSKNNKDKYKEEIKEIDKKIDDNKDELKKIDSEMEENKKKEGVITLPSGLQYEVITEGTGKKAQATDQVKCHYEGTLIDGTLFDSSVKRGQPAVFGVNQVIPGWVEALQLMSEGAKWKLYIPSDLAYGAQGAGELIPPHSALIFEVELIQVL